MNPEPSSLPQLVDLDAYSGHGGQSAAEMLRERDEGQEESDWIQFKRLLQAIEQLSIADTCDAVIQILRTAALNLAGSNGVLLVLPDGDRYRYVTGDELIPLLKNPRFPLISCVSDWVIRNQQTAVVPDVHTDERVLHDANEPTFVESLLMAPAGSGKEAIALGSYWIRHHLPDQKEIEVFEALARSTSAALRNIEVQAELKKKEHFYRVAMDAGRIGTWNLRLDTEECVVSPKMAQLMGLSAEQSMVPAAYWWEAIVPGDRLAVATALAASIEQHVPFDMHFRIHLPGGEERWLSSRGGVAREESGKALEMHGTSIDITERKKTEEALRASEERQRLIIESAREFAIFTTDTELRVTSWNPGAERLLGYSEVEIMGQDSRLLFTPEDRARRQPEQEEHEAFQTGRAGDERWHQRRDGTRFWGSGLAMPLRDGAGNIRGMLKILRDRTEERRVEEMLREAQSLLEERVQQRTEQLRKANAALKVEVAERKQAEEALAELNETLETLINASPLAIVAFGLDDNITIWNRAAERMFGWRAEEVLDGPLPNLPLENREWYTHQLSELLQTGNTWEGFETRRQRKDGTVLDVSIWATPVFNAQGGRTGMMALIADNTERKWLERALLEATEHEQRRIGQELHDGLCQSLAGTSLMVQVLAKSLRTEKNPKANDAEELGDLLLQTADQARQIAHGLHPVELETGGLAAILHRLTTSASQTVPCELRAPEPVFINDREKALHLYRIAQEAVENALQHAEAQRIVVSLTSTSSEILLEVQDDGHGFTLGENHLRTSLGLATMHYRASAIGATLSIHSHPGEGTLVRCRLSTKQL